MGDRSASDARGRHFWQTGRLLCGLASALGLTAAIALGGAGFAGAAIKRDPPPLVRSQQHVVICHALGNGGYNRVNPAVDNVVRYPGHAGHARDIIPPFDYVLSDGTRGHFPGLNWPAGEATWLNGCVIPPPPAGTIAVLRKCVTVHPDGTFDATFGYKSNAPQPVTLTPGPDNALTPTAYSGQEQTITFEPGAHVPDVLTVTHIAAGTTITWTVRYNGHTSSVSMSPSSDLECPGAGGGGPGPNETFHPISVFVTCVTNHGATYDATFGYDNENPGNQTWGVSDANGFSPAPQDRHQPTVFLPGVHTEAVTVTGIPASEELTWTLAFYGTFKAVASASFASKCDQPIEPPPTEVPPPDLPRPIGIFATCVYNHGHTYDATFGYANDNVGEVTIPIGSDNRVAPGPADQGQPEIFLPGFLNAAFTVRGVSNSHAVTWTIRFDHTKRVATADASFAHKCVTAPVDPAADAHVIKTAAPRTVNAGMHVRFTIDVRNTGSKVLQPAEVTDTLPAGLLRIVSTTSTLGSCSVTTAGGSHRVRCRAPALAPGESLRIHVDARATAGGTATDHAAVVGVSHATASATVHILGPSPHPSPPFTG